MPTKPYKLNLSISMLAVQCAVSMGLLTSARCCSISLTGPPQMLLHRGMPNSDSTATFPCPVHPAGWNTLALTHCRCMHIWLADHEFPDILRERHLAGYSNTHSREKACPLWGISEDKSWLMNARMLMDPKHTSAYSPGHGGSLKHLLSISALHI